MASQDTGCSALQSTAVPTETLAVQPCSLLLPHGNTGCSALQSTAVPTETLAVQPCSLILLSPRKHWLFSPAALYCCPHGNTGCSALQSTFAPRKHWLFSPAALYCCPHWNTGCSALQPYTAVPTETLAVQLCSLILLSPRKHWMFTLVAYCCPQLQQHHEDLTRHQHAYNETVVWMTQDISTHTIKLSYGWHKTLARIQLSCRMDDTRH